jgi:DNA (cytosine-5)-methyltransferase 1
VVLRALSLCSGIGGLDLALRRLGVVSVGYLERDAYAAAVLVDRMEVAALDRAPVWADLSTFDAGPWRGGVDLVSAGYPCQPFSLAGPRTGEHHPSHLWPHVRRIVERVAPPLVVLENVAGHLSLGFDVVLSDLAALGFDAEWGLFSAAEAGAPHRRERLFVLAYRDLDGLRELGRGGLLDGERSSRGNDADGRGGPSADVEHAAGPRSARRKRRQWNGEASGRAVPGGPGEGVAHELHGAHPGRGAGAEGPHVGDGATAAARRDGVGHADAGHDPRLHGERGERDPALGAWPPGPGDRDAWARVLAVDPLLAPALPAVRGVAHGLPGPLVDRIDRLRCLGNAVSPAQAELAICELARRALT